MSLSVFDSSYTRRQKCYKTWAQYSSFRNVIVLVNNVHWIESVLRFLWCGNGAFFCWATSRRGLSVFVYLLHLGKISRWKKETTLIDFFTSVKIPCETGDPKKIPKIPLPAPRWYSENPDHKMSMFRKNVASSHFTRNDFHNKFRVLSGF